MEFLILSPGSAVICLILLLLGVSWRLATRNPKNWTASYPVIGAQNNLWSIAVATLRSFSLFQEWVFEGYKKVSLADFVSAYMYLIKPKQHCRKNEPFILPCLDRGNTVIIPPKQLKKVYGLPESILDVYLTQNDTIQTKYTIGDQDIIKNGFQMSVIRHQLTRNLAALAPIIAEELKEGFDRYWGDTSEWKELRIWDSCLKQIAGAANGAFCGPPFCRNVAFLDSLRDHAMAMFTGALAVNGTPEPLRPVTGKIVSMICNYKFRKVLKLCLPFIKERLANTARSLADPSFDWITPKDGVQWIIEESYALKDPEHLHPVRVAHRLLYVNDISLHSTSFTVQNVILDIYNSEPSINLVEALREECATVLRDAGGKWTRAAVQKLKLVDATIRESMRLTPFASVGLPRTVIDPHGIFVDGPHGKLHIPHGTIIAMPMDPIHREASFYPDPNTFNPWRFTEASAVRSILSSFTSSSDFTENDDGATCRVDEQEERHYPPRDPSIPLARNHTESEAREQKEKSAVTLDDAFLGFGFGKHACAGRFFALNEMKIFVAHMVLHFDVRCLDRRPELTNIVWLKIPYNDGSVQVRKRVL